MRISSVTNAGFVLNLIGIVVVTLLGCVSMGMVFGGGALVGGIRLRLASIQTLQNGLAVFDN